MVLLENLYLIEIFVYCFKKWLSRGVMNVFLNVIGIVILIKLLGMCCNFVIISLVFWSVVSVGVYWV